MRCDVLTLFKPVWRFTPHRGGSPHYTVRIFEEKNHSTSRLEVPHPWRRNYRRIFFWETVNARPRRRMSTSIYRKSIQDTRPWTDGPRLSARAWIRKMKTQQLFRQSNYLAVSRVSIFEESESLLAITQLKLNSKSRCFLNWDSFIWRYKNVWVQVVVINSISNEF